VVAGKAERGEYVAEYSDYRKYGASSTIRYPNLNHGKKEIARQRAMGKLKACLTKRLTAR